MAVTIMATTCYGYTPCAPLSILSTSSHLIFTIINEGCLIIIPIIQMRRWWQRKL